MHLVSLMQFKEAVDEFGCRAAKDGDQIVITYPDPEHRIARMYAVNHKLLDVQISTEDPVIIRDANDNDVTENALTNAIYAGRSMMNTSSQMFTVTRSDYNPDLGDNIMRAIQNIRALPNPFNVK